MVGEGLRGQVGLDKRVLRNGKILQPAGTPTRMTIKARDLGLSDDFLDLEKHKRWDKL